MRPSSPRRPRTRTSGSTSSAGTGPSTKSSTASTSTCPSASSPAAARACSLGRSAFRATRSRARGCSRGSSAERRISLGRVNGRRFTFSAGLGLDAELVRRVGSARPPRREAAERRRLRRGARRHPRQACAAGFDPSMTVVGHGRVAFALVANCDPYTYVRLAAGQSGAEGTLRPRPRSRRPA